MWYQLSDRHCLYIHITTPLRSLHHLKGEKQDENKASNISREFAVFHSSNMIKNNSTLPR